MTGNFDKFEYLEYFPRNQRVFLLPSCALKTGVKFYLAQVGVLDYSKVQFRFHQSDEERNIKRKRFRFLKTPFI